MRKVLGLTTLLAIAGCASTFHAKIPPASATVAPAQCAGIWSAAFVELRARGFEIASHDPARGSLSTRTTVIPGRVPCGHLQCSYRDTVHVTVAPDGQVGVRIARELSAFWAAAAPGAVMGGERWEPPASTQRSTVAGVVADQDVLLRAILQRAAAPPAALQAAAPAQPAAAAAAAAAPAVPVPSAAAGGPEPVPAAAAVPQPAPPALPPPPAASPPPSPPAVAATAAVPASAVPVPSPAAPPAAPPRRLRLVASTGYDYGFEDLLTVRYENGSTDRLAANGGMVLSVGAAWAMVPSGAWELRATAGVKYDLVTGTNGRAYYVAFPLELLAGWNVRPIRLSAGTSLSVGPRVRGSGFLAPADLDLRSSLGLVGQADWVIPFRAGDGSLSVGLRYLWQKLEVSSGGRAHDASALGLAIGAML